MGESETMKYFDHLENEVHADLCANCGACVVSCPQGSLNLEGGHPILSGECTECGLCYSQCPQVVSDEEMIERIFGEVSSSSVGPYRGAYVGKTNSPEIEIAAQDGGLVTGMLTSLLNSEFIDGAVVMDRDSEWRPEPRVAVTEEELIESTGTKYSPGALLTVAREAVENYSLEEMAVVGTPCQIKALRNMASGGKNVREITDKVKLRIGLFCSESFNYEGFFQKVLVDQLDIDLSNVAKFDVDQGKFVIYEKGKSKRELSLDALDQFVFNPCRLCSDFAAELADVSVGSVGAPAGQSAAILRTEIGVEAFKKSVSSDSIEVKPMDEVDPGMDLIEKLSRKKKEEAERNVKIYEREDNLLPPRLQD